MTGRGFLLELVGPLLAHLRQWPEAVTWGRLDPQPMQQPGDHAVLLCLGDVRQRCARLAALQQQHRRVG
jgi:hypothetical protein